MSYTNQRLRILPCAILVTGLILTGNLYGQRTQAVQPPRNHLIGSAQTGNDAVRKGEEYVLNDVAKRVDSLQLVIVYNSDLVRNDLNNKLIWIYILLGGMVVSNVMMYAAFNQIRKQSQDAEDGLKIQLSELQGKLFAIAESLESAESAAGPKPSRRPSRPRSRSGKRS
jgi:hypothetical protein